MSETSGYRDAVAAYFRQRPGVWIPHRRFLRPDPTRPGHTLGGECGWRTRISECHTQLGMSFVTKTVYKRRRPARGLAPVVVSKLTFRKFVPPVSLVALTREASGQLAFGDEA
jgi:hypothetical protein